MEGKEKVPMNGWLNLKSSCRCITIQSTWIYTILNSDYEAKRYNNMTLNPLIINVARKNLFYDWLKDHDKLGGQHKIQDYPTKEII
jgi:hypothetical protein